MLPNTQNAQEQGGDNLSQVSSGEFQFTYSHLYAVLYSAVQGSCVCPPLV